MRWSIKLEIKRWHVNCAHHIDFYTIAQYVRNDTTLHIVDICWDGTWCQMKCMQSFLLVFVFKWSGFHSIHRFGYSTIYLNCVRTTKLHSKKIFFFLLEKVTRHTFTDTNTRPTEMFSSVIVLLLWVHNRHATNTLEAGSQYFFFRYPCASRS